MRPQRVSTIAAFVFVLGAAGPVWADAIVLSDLRTTFVTARVTDTSGGWPGQILAEQSDTSAGSGDAVFVDVDPRARELAMSGDR